MNSIGFLFYNHLKMQKVRDYFFLTHNICMQRTYSSWFHRVKPSGTDRSLSILQELNKSGQQRQLQLSQELLFCYYYVKRTVVAAVNTGDLKYCRNIIECSAPLIYKLRLNENVQGYCAQITLACFEIEMYDILQTILQLCSKLFSILHSHAYDHKKRVH